MAPVVAAPPTPVPNHNPGKIKRPPPAGIQTNGAAGPVRSSPSQSPSMPNKRPPPNAGPNGKQQAAQPPAPGAGTVAVNGVNGLTSRPSNISRSRRDTLTKKPGLRSSSQALDSAVSQTFPTRPEVITDAYILKKFAGNPPSLVVHLHPTHFRFDQQDGIFPYKSPMRIFLEHIKTRTVPHDLLAHFNEAGVQFYDGCLIVQIHDHKSAAQAKETNTRPTSASSKTAPFSIHNYNPYITPSPYVPFPKEEANGSDNAPAPSAEQKTATANGDEKESMPAPALPEGQKPKGPPKAKVITVVLHPTQSSLQHDLLLKALTPSESGDGSGMIPPPTPGMPPTPTTAVPKLPASKKRKREGMELDISNLAAVEGQILLATAGPLHLEPTKSVDELIEKLESRADPQHSEPPPQPKKRKRTVAERAADEAQAAEHQKYMLTMDERLSSTNGGGQSGSEGADGNGQSGGAVFEPRFERFKVIADIKREHAEKKEREKLHQAEQERKLAEQRKQQEAARQAENAEKARQEQEAARRARIQEQQRRAAHLQQQAQQAQQQQQQQQQAAAAQAAQAQAAAAQAAAAQSAQSPPNMQNQLSQASHSHPTPSPMPTAVPAHRFPQGVSQPPVSSPVVRQNTPQNMSSPMVGNVPMQQSNSGMGGSPARPSSVVQNHAPMGAPMAVSMSARGSQQSHPGGTPRMPSATPQMGQGTPINRPMPTPRLTQASPPPAMMATNSQPGQPMMMGNQSLQQQMQNLQNMHNMQNMQSMQNPMLAAQIAAQQRQRIAMQNQMGASMQQNGMLSGQNAQQMQQFQQFQQRQQQAQQLQQQINNMQNQSMLNPAMQAQLTQRYQQQIAQLQQQQQQMQNSMGNQQMGNMNFMNANSMNAGHMAAMQQLQQQNPQQQQQMMMQQQQQQQQQQQHQLPALVQQRQVQLYTSQIQQLAARFGGNAANIPVEVLNNFKLDCSRKARQWYSEQMAIRRSQAQQQQQQLMMQSQQGMPNGMMQGM